MSKKVPISVLIPTKDEELNIRQCLESVKWADEIAIIDSHSTDKTLEIAKEYTDKIYQFRWSGRYPKKKNWALENIPISHEWVLIPDADERISRKLAAEIKDVVENGSRYAGYIVRYQYWFLGRLIKHGDPVRKLIFFRHKLGNFEKLEDEHIKTNADVEVHEHPVIDGKIGSFKGVVLHHDERPLYFYLDRHNRYSTWEAELLFRQKYIKSSDKKIEARALGNIAEFRRLLKNIFLYLPFKPLVYFIYSYIVRFGFLDGYPGLCYNICKSIYAYQIGLKLHELKLKKGYKEQQK